MADLSPAQKRQRSLAVKKQQEKVINTLETIAEQIPDQWANTQQSKIALLKSIHKDILGVDKEGNPRSLDDLRYFMFQAAQRGLNPFKNQMHAVYIYDSQIKGERLVPITGIDGFVKIAQNSDQPKYAGMSEAEFEMYPDDDPKWAGYPFSCKVTIYAYNPINGNREPFTTATVYWDEYVKLVDVYENGKKTGAKKPNSTWQNRPKGQLEKCAQALGLRRAFAEEIGGLYIDAEVDKLKSVQNEVEEANDKLDDIVKAHKDNEQHTTE